MSYLEAIILGIIQGLTEFLPVSSSGHIELGKALMGIEIKESLTFTILLHCATVLSTIVIFYRQILDLLKGLFAFQWNKETQYVFFIALSMIPAGIVGVFFDEQIEYFFEGRILFVGFMLLVTGGLLMLTETVKRHDEQLDWKKSLLIGIAQMVAILPGVSRSGATISSALLLRVNKDDATQFSFLMVLPLILGATILKVKDLGEAAATEGSTAAGDGMVMAAGALAAFIAGVLACRWMIGIVRKGKIAYFAYYCFIIGILAIASHWL